MIVIVEQPLEHLAEYSQVPIAFEAANRFRVERSLAGMGNWELHEEPITPFVKDYDAISEEGPHTWPQRWDVSQWGLLAAYAGERRIGGAVIAGRTPGLDLLLGRDDLAVLWDLRVHPDYRCQGVGADLFAHVESWSRQRNYRQLLVETQNVNVAACRFYARQGCHLGEAHPFAYRDLPDEVQLLWYKDLLKGLRPAVKSDRRQWNF